jgi:hypothetical protein
VQTDSNFASRQLNFSCFTP